jgi:hypothetical protein
LCNSGGLLGTGILTFADTLEDLFAEFLLLLCLLEAEGPKCQTDQTQTDAQACPE